MRKLALAAVAAFALSTTVPTASRAADPLVSSAPVGTVTMSAKSAALGVGYTWGDGTLRFKGHTYHFGIQGLNVGAVGASRISGRGRVYDMTDLKQFSGTYAALTGEVTAGKGEGGQLFKNASTGVMLRVDNVTRGAKLSGSADGFQLTLR